MDQGTKPLQLEMCFKKPQTFYVAFTDWIGKLYKTDVLCMIANLLGMGSKRCGPKPSSTIQQNLRGLPNVYKQILQLHIFNLHVTITSKKSSPVGTEGNILLVLMQ